MADAETARLEPAVERQFQWVLSTARRTLVRRLLRGATIVGFVAGLAGIFSGTGPALVAAVLSALVLAVMDRKNFRRQGEFARNVRGLRVSGTRRASAEALVAWVRELVAREKRTGSRRALGWAVSAAAALDAVRLHDEAEAVLRLAPRDGAAAWAQGMRATLLAAIRMRADDAAGIDAALAEMPTRGLIPADLNTQAHVLRAGSLTLSGRHTEALALLDQARAPASNSWATRVRAYAYAALGDEPRAREVLADARKLHGDVVLERLATRDNAAGRIAAAMLREKDAPYR